MDDRERALLSEVVLGVVRLEDYADAMGVDPRADASVIPRLLREALAAHSADDVELVMILAFKAGLFADWAGVIGEALDADWHHSHEDLASALQDIRDPSSVPVLLRAAPKHHGYLDYDDAHALAVKCIWALHDIGTAEAASALEVLTHSATPIIADEALKRLHDLQARRPGDPTPAYRRARDARVRR